MDKEQLKADNWMCEQLNKIINCYFDRSTRCTAGHALVEISHVMWLANRLKEPGGGYGLCFSDHDRSNYKFDPETPAG